MEDRSWIHKSRMSVEYLEGIKKFIEFAIANNVAAHGRIRCPCQNCNNSQFQPLKDAADHMIRFGFVHNYTHWHYHGESLSLASNPSGDTDEDGVDDMCELTQDASETYSENECIVSASQRKGRRGRTLAFETLRLPQGMKFSVKVNSLGQPIGVEAQKLSSFIGTIARDPKKTPLIYTNWNELPESYKDALWQRVLEKYSISNDLRGWVMNEYARLLRSWRYDLRKIYKKYPTHAERLKHRHKHIPLDQWEHLMRYFDLPRSKMQSERNAVNCTKIKFRHTTGTKSFARFKAERFGDDETDPSRATVFVMTRTRSNEDHRNSELSEDQIKEKTSLLPEGSHDSPSREDVYSQVMGHDRRGRVRTYGLSVSHRHVFGPGPHESKLIKENAAYREEAAMLRQKVNVMEAQVEKMNELQDQVEKMHELEAQVEKMNEMQARLQKMHELEAQVAKMNELQAQLEKMGEMEARLQTMEAMEAKINKLMSFMFDRAA